MNILIICNTYYQILMAIQLKNTLFKKDIVDVMISDQCGQNHGINSKLEEHRIFHKVYFKKTKQLCMKKKKLLKKMTDLKKIIVGSTDFKDIYKNRYDELIFYNPDIAVHMIFCGLEKHNSNLICSRFEEGIFSYNTTFEFFNKLKYAYYIRKKMGKRNLLDSVDKFYCTNPVAYKGNKICINIPKIDLDYDQTGNQFTSLFNVQMCSYKQKYIYFAGVYDFEGGEPVGEIELINKIIYKVGKENLLVKVHPRDDITRFVGKGIEIDSNSGIPWEAVQLGHSFEEHVFLTLLSSSVLSVNMMLCKPVQTYFLYPICDLQKNNLASAQKKNIEGMLSVLNDSCYDWIHVTDILECI